MSFLLTVFLSCLSREERRAIGTYEVKEIEYKDSTSKGKLTVLLQLNRNKTYLLNKNGRSIKEGKWRAGDNGDRAWLILYVDDKLEMDWWVLGQSGEMLQILNSRDLDLIDTTIESLVLLRKDK